MRYAGLTSPFSFSLASLASLAFFVGIFAPGCGDDDPGGLARDPARRAGASPTSTGPTGSDASAPLFGPAVDAGPDTAPSYRDPQAGDGACTMPNAECATDDGGMACIDVSSDPQNCGKCGAACVGEGSVCIGRACACSAIGFAYCSDQGGCIDVTSDVNNCGQCGMVCDPGQFDACVGGSCIKQ